MNIKEKLSVLGNVFLTHREMSTDEAIYRLLSIPLRESNRKVIFLPTELPEQRTILLKSNKELESLPDVSVDIFKQYAARPKTLEHMCYADFASQYVTGSNTKQDNNLDDAVKVRNSKQQSITLQNKLGKMYRLKTPYFIRFHATPRRKDPESYCHRILMMYLPWRDHEELKFEGSYEKKLLMVSSQLVEKIEEYEGRLQELMDISVSEENIPQHA